MGKPFSAVAAATAAVISVWGIKPNLFLAQEKIAKRINYFSASFAPSQCFFQKKNFAAAAHYFAALSALRRRIEQFLNTVARIIHPHEFVARCLSANYLYIPLRDSEKSRQKLYELRVSLSVHSGRLYFYFYAVAVRASRSALWRVRHNPNFYVFRHFYKNSAALRGRKYAARYKAILRLTKEIFLRKKNL